LKTLINGITFSCHLDKFNMRGALGLRGTARCGNAKANAITDQEHMINRKIGTVESEPAKQTKNWKP
jgi:hypothetical protein